MESQQEEPWGGGNASPSQFRWRSEAQRAAVQGLFVTGLVSAILTTFDLAVGRGRLELLLPVLSMHLSMIAVLALIAQALVFEHRWVRTFTFGLTVFATAALWWATSDELASGDWIRRQSWVSWFRWGVLLVGFAGTLLVNLIGLRFRHRSWGPPAFAFLAMSLITADHTIFPGLYLRAHEALRAVGSWFLVLSASSVACRLSLAIWGTRRPHRFAVTGAMVAVLVVPTVAGILLLDGAYRSGLLKISPTAGRVWLQTVPSGSTSVTIRALKKLEPLSSGAREVNQGPGKRLVDNAIVVVVDNWRANSLPPHRPSQGGIVRPGDTPFLDAWLKETAYFTRAYSQASATGRSMPALHRSVFPWESKTRGFPLPALAASRGYRSIAVLPEFFVMPTRFNTQPLSENWDALSVFAYTAQQQLVPETRRLIRARKGQRFIAWLHFFCVHQPGSFDGRLLNGRDGSSVERYRRGVRWLDTQMRALVEMLQAEGLYENTAIVLTADHGDQQNEKGVLGHGQSVSQEELRIPLAFHLPGIKPREVDTSTSNIDVLPTLWAALGEAPHPTHRGHSLLPFLSGADMRSSPSRVYSENASGRQAAVFFDNWKATVTPRQGAYFLTELQGEEEGANVFSAKHLEGVKQRALELLVRSRPSLFSSEWSQRGIDSYLLGLIDSSLDYGREDFRFLLQVSAGVWNHSLREAWSEVLHEAGERDKTWEMLEAIVELYEVDKNFVSQFVVGQIERAVTSPEQEKVLARGLFSRGMPLVAESEIAARIEELSETKAGSALEDWLRLTASWRKSHAHWGNFFARAVVRGQVETLIWKNLASCKKSVPTRLDRPLASHLTDAQRAIFLEKAEVAFRSESEVHTRAVAETLAQQTFKHTPAFRERVGDLLLKTIQRERKRRGPSKRPRTHQALLHALVAVDRERGLAAILKERPQAIHALDMVVILEKLKDPRSIGLLKRISRRSRSQIARKKAKKLIEKLKS